MKGKFVNSNREFSAHIIEELLKIGVQEFYVCAGARNIPFIEVLLNINESYKFVFNHFEERSAAFYAIGRIKSLQKPVCVVTTSGTAVGELLPAVMEAYYSGLPLVLLTADRPKKYRGTGAPQSAEQNKIFGTYVSDCLDLDLASPMLNLSSTLRMPLHINVCLDIPLQNGELKCFAPKKSDLPNEQKSYSIEQEKLNKFINNHSHPLVVVSQINCKNQKSLVEFLKKVNSPIYFESISNLKEHPTLSQLSVRNLEKILQKYNADCVLKIGGTPTHRFWRDLEEIQTQLPIFSIGKTPFSGSTRAEHICVDFECFQFPLIEHKHNLQTNKVIQQDRLFYKKMSKLFVALPKAEQSLVHTLSKIIPTHSRVFLGNSLSIRNWDAFADETDKRFLLEASRGLNGIDGQLSTFYGFADPAVENWALFGDLTALYDLAAPWVLQHLKKTKTTVVIVNNGGGKIFNKIFKGKEGFFCQNEHKIQFEYWAKMWNMAYSKADCISKLNSYSKTHEHTIYELLPCPKQTQLFELEFNLLMECSH